MEPGNLAFAGVMAEVGRDLERDAFEVIVDALITPCCPLPHAATQYPEMKMQRAVSQLWYHVSNFNSLSPRDCTGNFCSTERLHDTGAGALSLRAVAAGAAGSAGHQAAGAATGLPPAAQRHGLPAPVQVGDREGLTNISVVLHIMMPLQSIVSVSTAAQQTARLSGGHISA